MRLLGLSMERERLDKSTRRNVKHDRPKAMLRLATPGGSIRQIELSDDDLAALVRATAQVVAERLREDR